MPRALPAHVRALLPSAERADAAQTKQEGQPGEKRPNKYRNTPVTVDGIKFDSKVEAARYVVLRVMEQQGVISGLEVHPSFPLVIHDQPCGVYEADFAYLDAQGRRHVEDVKSPATRKLPTYRLKRKLVWAIYGLVVEEAS